MEIRKLILPLIGMGIVIGTAYLSQQPYTAAYGKNLQNQAAKYIPGIQGWSKASVMEKVDGEVEHRKAIATEEVEKQADEVKESLWGNIKNYFAAKFSIFTGGK